MPDAGQNPPVVGQFIGDLRGTVVGNLYVEFMPLGDRLLMKVHANSGDQPVVMSGYVEEKTTPPSATLNLTEEGMKSARELGEAPVETFIQFDRITKENVSGRWENTAGDAGVFRLSRQDTVNDEPVTAPKSPVEIVSRTHQFPRFSLYRSDLTDIVSKLKEIISTPNDVVIRFGAERPDDLTFAEDFFNKTNLRAELGAIQISLTDANASAPKTIVVNISNDIAPSVTITSDDRRWVEGALVEMKEQMRQHYTLYLDWFQRYALNLNGVALLIAIGALPALPNTASRYIFLAAIIGLIIGYKRIHDRVNRVRIYPKAERKNTPYLDWPQIFTGVVGAIVVSVAGLLVTFFSADGLTEVLDWLSEMLAEGGAPDSRQGGPRETPD